MVAQYITADDGTGNVQTMLVSDFLLLNPTANIRTPSASFSFQWNGVLTDYVFNQPVVLTADLWAALQAAGFPIS